MSVEMDPELRAMPVGSIEQNTALAHAALKLRLQTPAEQELLREFQVDATSAITEALARGESAFHIAEATGLGKTAIALQIAQTLTPVLGKDGCGKTIFVSPTIGILQQTQRSASRFAEGATMTNYYGHEKNIGGDIINTTYDSLLQLVNLLTSKKQDVRLIICDEVHTAQGPATTKAFTQIPNAILLGLTATPNEHTIQQQIREGTLTGNERWIQMFRRRVHEIRIGEGIARGILSKLDMHLVWTSFDATGVTVESTGEYSQGKLERFLSNQARSAMAVAMVAQVPIEEIERRFHVEFTDEQKAQITDVNTKISGKKILMFGQTTDHVDAVQKMLAELGVKAATYHSKIKVSEREAAEKAFESGEIQVLLGVRSLGVGLDMPEAEVGIFMVPRRSAVDVEQELGRIMRLSPGKERAIAIQLLDEFERGDAPVLLPEILDPDELAAHEAEVVRYTVRRGVHTGNHADKVPQNGTPSIIFSGLRVATIFEHIRAEQLARSRLQSAKNIGELDKVVQATVDTVMQTYPTASPLEQYQAIADILPERLPGSVNQMAYEAAIRGEVGGIRTLVFLNMKTILRLAHKYGEGMEEEDIVQETISRFMEHYDEINTATSVSFGVLNFLEDTVTAYVADRSFMNVLGWVRQGWYKRIKSLADIYLSQFPDTQTLPIHGFADFVRRNMKDFGGSNSALDNYIAAKTAIEHWEEELLAWRSDKKELDTKLLQEVMEEVLRPREGLLLHLRYGLGGTPAFSLEATGRQLGITRERVRQIEAGALAKLRHPQSIRRLRDVQQ